jgi:hypothetical protein
VGRFGSDRLKFFCGLLLDRAKEHVQLFDDSFYFWLIIKVTIVADACFELLDLIEQILERRPRAGVLMHALLD